MGDATNGAAGPAATTLLNGASQTASKAIAATDNIRFINSPDLCSRFGLSIWSPDLGLCRELRRPFLNLDQEGFAVDCIERRESAFYYRTLSMCAPWKK